MTLLRATAENITRRNNEFNRSFKTNVWFDREKNKKMHKMIRNISTFLHELIKRFIKSEEPVDFELRMLFRADTKNIIDFFMNKQSQQLKLF